MEGLLYLGSSSFLRRLIKDVCYALKSFEGKRSLVVKLLKLFLCARMFRNLGCWGKTIVCFTISSSPNCTNKLCNERKQNGQLIQIPNYMQQGKGKSEEDMTGAQGLSDSK